MSANGIAADVLLEFVVALREQRDAAEFDRLMLGGTREPTAEIIAQIGDINDGSAIRRSLDDDASALDRLRGDRAVDRLTARHPELWERVNLEALVDA